MVVYYLFADSKVLDHNGKKLFLVAKQIFGTKKSGHFLKLFTSGEAKMQLFMWNQNSFVYSR